MSSAPLVRCDQNIPNSFRREKNIIWWYNLEGILGEGSLAEHRGNLWDCHKPRGFLGSLSIYEWASVKQWKDQKTHTQLSICVNLVNHFISLGLSFLKHKLRGVLGGAKWLNMISTPRFLVAWLWHCSETILGSHSNPGPESCFSLAPDQVWALPIGH